MKAYAALAAAAALGGCVNPYPPPSSPGYFQPPASALSPPPRPTYAPLPPVVFQPNLPPDPTPDPAGPEAASPLAVAPSPAIEAPATELPPPPLVIAAPPGTPITPTAPPVDKGGSGVPLMGFRPMRGQTPAATP